MKKRIVTQEIKRWNRRDRLFSLVFWATAFLFIVSLCGTFGSVRAIDDAPGFLLSMFVFYVVVALAVTLPLYILGKAVIRRFRRRAMEAATFESVQEMTYYRDRLEGLTPTLISYLTDLKLEPKKDITALILQYQLWGILVPTETHYAYPDITDPRLQRSDRSLLAWIYRNQEGAVTAWERQSRQEAIASGYLRASVRRAPQMKGMRWALNVLFIGTLALIVLFTLNGDLEALLAFIDQVEHLTIDPASLDRGTLAKMSLLTLFSGFAYLGLAAPFAVLISDWILQEDQATLVRTRQGEAATELIWGMKNFIHDFTLLGERDQESLALWDEFLIYAVLLEENTRIVEAIFFHRQVSLGALKDRVDQRWPPPFP